MQGTFLNPIFCILSFVPCILSFVLIQHTIYIIQLLIIINSNVYATFRNA